jgi:DNA polymerase III alpha subunit
LENCPVMKNNQYGELVLDNADLCNLIMQGRSIADLKNATVDSTVNIRQLAELFDNNETFTTWAAESNNVTVEKYDHQNQQCWHMPDTYKKLDIAAHILGLCQTDAELQRAGSELMLYQERDLFDLLRYLAYLVDVMRENRIIWGVGRGSSVASYVLYLLGVHKIDSMYYDLDITEFLR